MIIIILFDRPIIVYYIGTAVVATAAAAMLASCAPSGLLAVRQTRLRAAMHPCDLSALHVCLTLVPFALSSLVCHARKCNQPLFSAAQRHLSRERGDQTHDTTTQRDRETQTF